MESNLISSRNALDPSDDSDVASLCARADWAGTPLGPRERWPQSLRTVVDLLLSSKFSMWMGWGPELTFFYNDAYRRDTLGVKHPWALGKPAREVWAEIWADIGPRIQQVLEKGEATWDEALLLFLERSGYREETYHTFSYSPVRDDSGGIAGMFCAVAEVTEQVIGGRRLALLRELASRLAAAREEPDVFAAIRTTLEKNTKDLPFTATYVFDATHARATLAASTGLSAGQPAAPAVIDLAGDEACWPATAMLTADGLMTISDLRDRISAVPTGAWETAPDAAALVPIVQRAGGNSGFLVVGLNPFRLFDAGYRGFLDLIAGQIGASLANARAYEQERQRAAALAEIDRAKTTFFSNVSHEFRTPLTLLIGPLEDALRRADVPSQVRTELSLAHRNSLRLLKLVNSLLDFTRIEAGRAQAVYQPTDLAAVTADLASSFRSACERAGLTLTVEASPLPRPVYVDRDMWEKVVLNLLSNAFKHTFRGGITVRVTSGASGAELQVEDTGVGISREELPRIFERFHRVPHAKSRTHEGTGIGLALVQEIVRRHGGTIDVHSVEDRGTRFTVRLPFAAAHLPSDRVREDAVAVSTTTGSLGAAPFVEEALRWLPESDAPGDASRGVAGDEGTSGGDVPASAASAATILLADDNADMRDYVARLLKAEGWTVHRASDGSQALELTRRLRPDVVVSDVMMPGLDGFALLRALRSEQATAEIPVILLSARAGEEARVEGAQAGANDYLAKPFSAQELIARVGLQLSLARDRRRATVAMEAARDLLTRVLEQAPVGICVLRGADHIYELANAFYRQFLPGDRPIIGRPVRDVVPEAEGQGFIALLDRVRTTGEPWIGRGVEISYDRQGTGVPESAFLNLLYHPFYDFDGSIVGVIAVVSEVTDEVRARRDAEAARREAEEARAIAEDGNRAKSEFLAVMSHELRTPLNAIGGYAELMELGINGPLTEAQRDSLGRITRSQRHLLGLINDVLNLARIETGRLEYNLEAVSVCDVLDGLVPMIEGQFSSKGVTYDATGVDQEMRVVADRDKLAQVLLNLLSNAVKFTPSGGHVTVHATRRASMVEICIEDTGIGIPTEKLGAIFEPFVQVRVGPTRATEGAGLGLAISRDLALGMHGELTVTSAPGEGSRFTLVLPSA